MINTLILLTLAGINSVAFSVQSGTGTIFNPIISVEDGTYDEVKVSPLTGLIIRVWKTMVLFGGLMLLVYLIWGAIEWISSGGDGEKVKSARNKLTNALIGLFLLVASFAIMIFLRELFGYDLLNIIWPTAENMTS